MIPTIINVVSGKGGTGKSLLCAVLGRLLGQEGARVLLVDLDVYVRGLTYFFYLYKKEKRTITTNQTVADRLGLSPRSSDNDAVALERFYEVDLMPAVHEIEEKLDYIVPTTGATGKIRELIAQLHQTDFDYIFLDNRAGVDQLILTSAQPAQVVLAVSEADPIARTTNENLLRHLDSFGIPKAYTLINKAKYVRSLKDYERSMEGIRGDFKIIGQIPFDVDLFESFGTAHFWDGVNRTRYAYALAESWNKLASREELKHKIDMKRFPASVWNLVGSPSFMNKFERVSILGGIVCVGMWYLYGLLAESGTFHIKDIFLIYGLLLFAFPFVRRFLGPPRDNGDGSVGA
jgi:septum site-determining protein MinD